VFCLHGPAGSGKTVLSSVVLRDLDQPPRLGEGSHCVFYCYFDYRDAPKNKASCLIDCLLHQILCYDPAADRRVRDLRDSLDTKDILPTPEGQLFLIRDLLLSIACQKTVYIVIDAIEECSDFFSPSNDVLKLLEDLVGWSRQNPTARIHDGASIKHSIRFFISSSYKVRDCLLGSSLSAGAVQLDLRENNQVREDIHSFVKGSINSMNRDALKRIDEIPGLREQIIQKIIDGSDGL
jgi:hypothetical protein